VSFLRPFLLPVVKLVLGKLVTQEMCRQAIDVVFAEAHKLLDPLPTKGRLLAEIESQVDKDALAKMLDAALDGVI
jgi:hypothetical protein